MTDQAGAVTLALHTIWADRGLTDAAAGAFSPTPAERDQIDAATAALLAATDALPALGLREAPEWLALTVTDELVGWVLGSSQTCAHAPSVARPQPVHAASWAPGLVVCARCVAELQRTSPPRCALCGDVDAPARTVVLAAVMAYVTATCTGCAPGTPPAAPAPDAPWPS